MTTPDRRIPFSRIANGRDVGGLPARGGAVRTGQLFRSAAIAAMVPDDAAMLRSLGVATVYDLRTEEERSKAPDPVEPGVRIVPLNVLADRAEDAAAGMDMLTNNPEALAEMFAGGAIDQVMEESYQDIVALPSALDSYRAYFRDLIDPDRTGAALVHCTTGKDRTGWAVASLLLLLGVPARVVREDYLQTNTDLLPAMKPIIDNAVARGIPREPLLRVLGVQDSYIEVACSEVRSRWGSIEGYAFDGLGLTDSDMDALQARFVA